MRGRSRGPLAHPPRLHSHAAVFAAMRQLRQATPAAGAGPHGLLGPDSACAASLNSTVSLLVFPLSLRSFSHFHVSFPVLLTPLCSFSQFRLDSLRTGVMAGTTCPVDIMKRVRHTMYTLRQHAWCGLAAQAAW